MDHLDPFEAPWGCEGRAGEEISTSPPLTGSFFSEECHCVTVHCKKTNPAVKIWQQGCLKTYVKKKKTTVEYCNIKELYSKIKNGKGNIVRILIRFKNSKIFQF